MLNVQPTVTQTTSKTIIISSRTIKLLCRWVLIYMFMSGAIRLLWMGWSGSLIIFRVRSRIRCIRIRIVSRLYRRGRGGIRILLIAIHVKYRGKVDPKKPFTASEVQNTGYGILELQSGLNVTYRHYTAFNCTVADFVQIFREE